MILSSKQKSFLKGEAHHLKAQFQIGKNGITKSVIKAISDFVNANELVKVKVLEVPEDQSIEDIATILSKETKATTVSTIGKNIILFKRNNKKPIIDLPIKKK